MKTCKRLLAVLLTATLMMGFCISASAEDFSVTAEKAGEIANTLDVFTGGKNESFSYYYLGSGFGVPDQGHVRIVDVNGENHIDKLYDKVEKIYHGKYQLGDADLKSDNTNYDLIQECRTICCSDIEGIVDLNDDLFVFASKGNYVVFDLEEARELAGIPAASGKAGLFDDEYWILKDGKCTFYDDDGKEVYSTTNSVLMDWDGRLKSYDHNFFVEKSDDKKYHIHDTSHKEVLTLNAAPDRILHDGEFYVEDKVLYDRQGKRIVELPGNDRVYELEDSFLIRDTTEAKKSNEYYTFYLYDYSGTKARTFECKGIEESFGCGYYVLRGKDKDTLICPDGKTVEGFYDRGAVFRSSKSDGSATDLFVLRDGGFTLRDMTGACGSTNYELRGPKDPEILAQKELDREKRTIAVYNILDGKLILDTDARRVLGCVGDYFAVESASDSNKWVVYRMNIDD